MSEQTNDEPAAPASEAEPNPPDVSRGPPKKKKRALGLSYVINESPPWYICIFLGFQHYLTMLGSTLAIPFIVNEPMCFKDNYLVTSEVLSTIFFVSGIATLLQTTFGVRLPIVQGGTFTFLAPTFAILSLPQWACSPPAAANETLVPDSGASDESWKLRMREIQGAIAVSSLFQIAIGFSGLIGVVLKFIGPLTVAPTITLVGLGLFPVAAEHAGSHWGISAMTISFICIFSQAMYNVKIPIRAYRRGRGSYTAHYPLFRLFPIILAITISWIVCAIVTAAGGFPSDPSIPAYKARTDARTTVLGEASWFRVPYPGQWGLPTVSVAGVFGMLAGVLASLVESVGDYYACARMCGAPPPPKHAVNRGIGMEGVGCLLAGLLGSGNGTTSYSENIGAIGITKVGSRRVVQFGALVMLVVGIVGKVGALFTTIPDPIVGGVFMVMFGMIAAVGIANLQYVDMNSSRNLFIVGASLLLGMALPQYMATHKNAIQTGSTEIDQILTVLLSTNMAVGGIIGMVLDNLLPGTPEERGLVAWRQHLSDDHEGASDCASIDVYNLPFGLDRLSSKGFAKYVPFLPYHQGQTLFLGTVSAMELTRSEAGVDETEE